MEFKRNKPNIKEQAVIYNIDTEINKIINEALVEAKGNSNTNIVIDPYGDLKKLKLLKDIPNTNSKKRKLITKKDNKILIKEINKL